MSKMKNLCLFLFLRFCIVLAEDCPRKGLHYFGELKDDTYLLGTLHFDYDLIWERLPTLVKESFEESGVLVLEHDQTKPSWKEYFKLCPKSLRSLEDILDDDAFEWLEIYMEKIKPEEVDNDEWSNLWTHAKPHLLVYLIHLRGEAINGSKVDEKEFNIRLEKLAKEQKKEVMYIEKPEDDCDRFSTLKKEEINSFLMYESRRHLARIDAEKIHKIDPKDEELQKADEILVKDQIIEDYLCGKFAQDNENLKDMFKDVEEYMLPVDKLQERSDIGFEAIENHQKWEAYKVMQENKVKDKIWTRRIEEIMETEPNKKHFFAIGATHFKTIYSHFKKSRSKNEL